MSKAFEYPDVSRLRIVQPAVTFAAGHRFHCSTFRSNLSTIDIRDRDLLFFRLDVRVRGLS